MEVGAMDAKEAAALDVQMAAEAALVAAKVDVEDVQTPVVELVIPALVVVKAPVKDAKVVLLVTENVLKLVLVVLQVVEEKPQADVVALLAEELVLPDVLLAGDIVLMLV